MSMPSKLHGSMRGAYEFAISFLGATANYESVDGSVTRTATVGFRHVGRDDAEAVNAYGPGVVAITCAQKDFPTSPKKFDSFTVNGKVYIVQAAHHAVLNANVVGWRVYATGK